MSSSANNIGPNSNIGGKGGSQKPNQPQQKIQGRDQERLKKQLANDFSFPETDAGDNASGLQPRNPVQQARANQLHDAMGAVFDTINQTQKSPLKPLKLITLQNCNRVILSSKRVLINYMTRWDLFLIRLIKHKKSPIILWLL